MPTVQGKTLAFCEKVFRRSDAQLFAVTLMTNHLHLVVRQGSKPLSRIMQPLLRRIALAVQQEHKVKDHVFGARYFSSHCADAEYVRTAIIYTHLNPWKAKICSDPIEYTWCSHAHYAVDREFPPGTPPVAFREGLRLFKKEDGEPLETTRLNYLAAVRERMELLQQPEAAIARAKSRMVFAAGDADWITWFQAPYIAPNAAPFESERAGDLRDIAIETALEIMKEIDLELLCTRWGGRAYSNVRIAVARRLHLLGFRNIEIAEFLNLSPSRVSHMINDGENRGPAASG